MCRLQLVKMPSVRDSSVLSPKGKEIPIYLYTHTLSSEDSVGEGVKRVEELEDGKVRYKNTSLEMTQLLSC